MDVPQDESQGRAEVPGGQPANILWRILQAVCDDLIIMSFVLPSMWALGVLTLPAEWPDVSGGPRAFAESAARTVTLTQVGATLLIYAAVKFVYYVAFVTWGGRTPACHLLRLRIVKTDGTPASAGNAVRRAVAGGFIVHAPGVGQLLRLGDYLAALFNRRKQAVRDMLAGTMLVHQPRLGDAADGPQDHSRARREGRRKAVWTKDARR